MGIDWEGYQELYASMPPISRLLSGGGLLPLNVEPGYQLYMSVFKLLSMHPNWLPTGLFTLSVAIVLRGCRKWNIPPLPMTAMITMLIYPHFFEQIRMAFVYMLGISIGIAMLHNDRRSVLSNSMLAASVQYIGIAYIFNVFWRESTVLAASTRSHGAGKVVISGRRRVIVIAALLSASAVAYRFSEPLLGAMMQPFALFINPVSEKLLAYYIRREEVAVSFAGASFLVFSGIALVWLSNRDSIPNRQKVIFRSGVALLLSVTVWLVIQGFPALSHRIVSMMVKPTLAILASHVTLTARRQGWLYILLSMYSVYSFGKLTDAVGPYSWR
jgi:hypothetical protein